MSGYVVHDKHWTLVSWIPESQNKLTRIEEMKAPITRDEVYALIDGERYYQDNVIKPDINRTGSAGMHSVGEFLVMMDTYLKRAMRAWTEGAGDRDASDNIRKVAGIAVTCMEQNGAPEREFGASSQRSTLAPM